MVNELKELVNNTMEIDSQLSRYNKLEIYDVKVFMETWESTALGFGGVGGQAFTNAYTTVVECDIEKPKTDEIHHMWMVFFGGRIAYTVENPTKEFFEDLQSNHMVSCREASGRY